jgi:hypothetical protein
MECYRGASGGSCLAAGAGADLTAEEHVKCHTESGTRTGNALFGRYPSQDLARGVQVVWTYQMTAISRRTVTQEEHAVPEGGHHPLDISPPPGPAQEALGELDGAKCQDRGHLLEPLAAQARSHEGRLRDPQVHSEVRMVVVVGVVDNSTRDAIGQTLGTDRHHHHHRSRENAVLVRTASAWR